MQKRPIFIGGPCAMESYELSLDIAKTLKNISEKLGFDYYLKSSFDKANRSSWDSFRGPGLYRACEWFRLLKEEIHDIKIVTDVHESNQPEKLIDFVDVIQIPAFLCRQTDLIRTAAETGKTINIKKGQFLSPYEMQSVLDKCRHFNATDIWFTERGTFFGYNNLVVDMKSLKIMRDMGVTVIFDATHSIQKPSKDIIDKTSGDGDVEFSESLMRAAAAVKIDGYFAEVHPSPATALSDKSRLLKLDDIEGILERVLPIHKLVHSY